MAQIEYTIKVRRDTATNWTSSNTVLAEGEFGYESDTGRLKIGDGSTPWVSLVYGVVTEDMIGTPNGVVPLNGSGTIDPSYFSVTATTDSVGYQTSLKINNPTHVDTVQEVINHHWSTGVIEGCALTNNGDGTINLASGFAMIRGTASEHADLYSAAINAQNNITLTNDATNYIYLSYNAGSPTFLVTTDITTINGLDETLTYIVHCSGTTLNTVNVIGQNVDIGRKLGDWFRGFSTFVHGAGGSVLSNPSTTTIAVSAGKFYFQLNEIAHTAFDTTVAGTANANVFTLWYRNGSGGFTSVPNQKTITATTYDSGTGTPVTLGNNKYGVTWFYISHDSPSSLHAVMGQAEYATESAAKVSTPPSSLPNLLAGMGSILGSVVYLKGASTFLDVLSAFTTTYNPSMATNHNGLAGLQGGQTSEYYHLTSNEYTGTGTGTFVRQTDPGIRFNTSTKVANYTIGLTDYTIRGDASGGAIVITLPNATTCEGQLFVVKKVDSSSNAVTVNTTAAQTIDGSLTAPIYVQFASITLQSNGTNFDIL